LRIEKYFLILKYIKFLLLFFVFNNALSSPADSVKKSKIGALPSCFFTPETRFGFGVFMYSYFNTDKASIINKKSNAQTYLSYTINKQFSLENDFQIWLSNNKFILTGGLNVSRFPEFFYGISNDTKESDKIMISFDDVKLKSKNLVRLQKNLYFGCYYQFEKLYNLNNKLKQNMTNMCELIPGGAGYSASGTGPIFIYDKRDNPLNPAKGSYLETSLQHFNKAIGSQYKFTAFIFDVRKYNTLFKKLIWNGNAYFFFNKGEVPFRMLATIGGARFLRGYYRGRFRDNNMIVLQQEFRMPIYKWFGLAAFGGVGSVAKVLKDFQKNEIHYNYGFGLRIKINKKENTNLRLDYGITKDSQGIYLIFAEAF